jgi:hypothetical protein
MQELTPCFFAPRSFDLLSSNASCKAIDESKASQLQWL